MKSGCMVSGGRLARVKARWSGLFRCAWIAVSAVRACARVSRPGDELSALVSTRRTVPDPQHATWGIRTRNRGVHGTTHRYCWWPSSLLFWAGSSSNTGPCVRARSATWGKSARPSPSRNAFQLAGLGDQLGLLQLPVPPARGSRVRDVGPFAPARRDRSTTQLTVKSVGRGVVIEPGSGSAIRRRAPRPMRPR